ncbi:hypothetical protein L4D08_08410 [Photobacterium chitinilyticum]|uniref:hypothetical protein n=1 Tax=Photobacterium chitinilyticum TaxID=2485123 RepID=UPI003D0EB3CE
MNTAILSKLSLLSNTISKPYRSELREELNATYGSLAESVKEQVLNVYAAFLYSQELDNFNALEIVNDKNQLQEHLDYLIGFIYSTQTNSIATRKKLAKTSHKAFVQLAKGNNFNIPKQSFHETTINEYTQSCIDKYQALPISQERLDYLDGWTVTSQSRETVLVNLDVFYVRYGRDFSAKVHEILKRYALTQKTSTLRSRLPEIISMLESVAVLDKSATVGSFELLLSARNVQTTFHKVYQMQLTECIFKGNDLYNYNKTFLNSLEEYQSAFINTRAYPSPLKPFIRPDVKKVKNPPSFSSGGKASEAEKVFWFADIPLHIKDEEAIEIMEERLDRAMSFLRKSFTNHFEELKERQNRNRGFLEEGLVKPLTGNVSGRGTSAHPVGSEHLANTIATFHRYGIDGYTGRSYENFLGYNGSVDELLLELNLPTNSTLLTLTSLLVMEHPKITPSWLQKLQLFDEHGKKRCYFQSGEQYILSGEKERRGRALAQQDVILNDFSKSIVDFIIEHTQVAREHLKSIGNPNWRYLLLTCSLTKVVKPRRTSQLYKNHAFLTDFLKDKKCISTECKLSEKEIETIASIPVHRSIRRHRGLQIYLETRSQSAVAEALGHKDMRSQLLESYLPKPLMQFFTERVVRQFQKAIILKSMEDSPYLLDAVNMSYEEIEEFLKNHGIDEIPDLNVKAFDTAQSTTERSVFDSIIFTVTVPLIQLLISIRAVIEGGADKDNVTFKTELVEHWYHCAAYLLSRFEQGEFEGNDDIKDMYQEAQSNPLNLDVIKGAISC